MASSFSGSSALTRRAFLSRAGAALAAAGTARAGQAAPGGAPNVLMVVVDTLRADHLRTWGYTRDTAPFMDALAKEGVCFKRAMAQSSFTRESVSSLITGLYPGENLGTGWQAQPRRGTTLAEQFAAHGYRTAMFSNNQLLGSKGFSRGMAQRTFGDVAWDESGFGPVLARDAAAFLEVEDSAPFFTYVHFMDPHAPYDPPRSMYLQFAERVAEPRLHLYGDINHHLNELVADGFGPGDPRFQDLVDRYDAEIRTTDYAVSLLFDALVRAGKHDNTIVLLLSDHGEEFLDHGFVEHAWRLYRESIHVPLVFWYPPALTPATVSDCVALVDVYPSLLALAGMPVPDGMSGEILFKSTGSGYAPATRKGAIFSEFLVQSRNIMRTIIQDEWKYTAAVKWVPTEQLSELAGRANWEEARFERGERQPMNIFGATRHEELYNIAEDPLERNNVASTKPDIRNAFREQMTQYYAHCQAIAEKFAGDATVLDPMTEEEIRNMRSLGYL